jgi:predicted deacetylase
MNAQGPLLLASIHDVSPLTLVDCQQAVALLQQAAGIFPSSLTLLVIPDHEGRARLDQDRLTVRWLRAMADAGATLAMHGLTHRMPRRSRNPLRFPVEYGFARGQGEFYGLDAVETRDRLAQAKTILRQAALDDATRRFVPPAWLLSKTGRQVIEAAGFDWFELYDGLHGAEGARALRLIGWGSLNPIEAAATIVFSAWQSRRAAADTRLCVHPADLRRSVVRKHIQATVRHLRQELTPLNYADYLTARPLGRAAAATPPS